MLSGPRTPVGSVTRDLHRVACGPTGRRGLLQFELQQLRLWEKAQQQQQAASDNLRVEVLVAAEVDALVELVGGRRLWWWLWWRIWWRRRL